ncbi:MAG TPA: carbon starvation protein A [Bacteroidetes bacterium]|nr:carbon starvation protein A [Bacteroidota bacterium]
MNSFLLVVLALAGYIVAYHTYGKWLGSKIFRLSDATPMPSHELHDGVDFVPAKKHILFGHHFTTIAGLGPIVGPAIGIIWGWLPAFIWVFVGSIFMGAVHDFSTLVISARHQGKSLGELTGDLISPSARYAFQFIMQFLLFIVLSVFVMIEGVLFGMYPESVIPVWLQIPIAVWLGWKIRSGKNDLLYSLIAVFLLYLTIVAGAYLPVKMFPLAGSPVNTWCLILFVYVFFASAVPVQKLLQPRDYINAHQLIIAMGLLFLGLAIAHPPVSAPAVNPSAYAPGSDVPALMPILFITIACGAISGFHSLASSGTTVKQVDREKDTLFVGYGGMIWESFLAVLVLMAVAAGLGMGMEKEGILYTGREAFDHHYTSWASAEGLGAKLEAFITGAANLCRSLGIPVNVGQTLIAVFIVSFANTTLDSATRIQRLSLQEIFRNRQGKVIWPMNHRYVATFFVVLAAALMTFTDEAAQGAMKLWPLFGSLNQLLAALALGVVTVYLFRKKWNIWVAFLPMVLVLIFTLWAMFENLIRFIEANNLLLTVISCIILFLTAWLLYACLISVAGAGRKGDLSRRPGK